MSTGFNLIPPVPAEIDPALLAKAVALITADHGADLPPGAINLKFTSDGGIRKLNRDYSGNDYATDVLSFSYIPDQETEDGIRQIETSDSRFQIPDSDLVVGEVIISTETAQRQANDAGIKLSDEVTTLTIHGVLHILGIDHQTPDGTMQMDKLQAGYAKQLGIKYRNFDWQ